jgi:hypothetical protein
VKSVSELKSSQRVIQKHACYSSLAYHSRRNHQYILSIYIGIWRVWGLRASVTDNDLRVVAMGGGQLDKGNRMWTASLGGEGAASRTVVDNWWVGLVRLLMV